jgi:S1-C subfamily serine protease
VNPLDIAAVALLIFGAVLGFRSGALPQIGGLLGAAAGAVAVIAAIPFLSDLLASIDPQLRPFVVLAGLLIAVGIGESVGSAIGLSMTRRIGGGVLDAADRIGGAFVGVAQAVLIIWLIGGLVALGPFVKLTETAQTSTVIRTLNQVLPEPGDLAVGVGKMLDETGLPSVFVGFEPLPQAPVDRPDDPTTQAIARNAIRATVKVSAGACGYTSSGTGFSVAEGYVVTNAHVVAGADRRAVRVTAHDGSLLDAIPVAFDPKLDIAVLHVPELGLPALAFAEKEPKRGSLGAGLGYPGGGPLVVVPAAVTGAYEATGRDIYGADRVRREIIELRAEIDRGDSGGPFVLVDGTVGGLVFAEARTDDQVGYALSGVAVWERIEPVIGRTKSVDTGDCLR